MEQDIREIITTAAEKLLSKYGFKKMTIEDIAHEAGFSHSTIYKYFKGKREIVAEVAMREAQHSRQQIEQIIEEELPGLKKLEKILLYIMERILTRKNMYQITTSDFIELYPIIEKVIVSEEQRARRNLKKVITQIKEEYNAKFDPQELTDALFFIIAGINNLLILKNYDKEEVLYYFKYLFQAFEEIEKGECQ